MVTILKSRLTYSHLCTVLSSYAKFIMNAFVPEELVRVKSDLRYDIKMFSVENYKKQFSNSVSNNIDINLNEKTLLPHLVHYMTEDIETSQDIKTPFLLKLLNPDRKDEEIVPTKVPKNDNVLLDDSESDNDSDDSDIDSNGENFIYDNDKLIGNLENVIYIAMDWITLKYIKGNFNFSVKLTSIAEQLNFNKLDDNFETLDSCLESFIEPEILGPQNYW